MTRKSCGVITPPFFASTNAVRAIDAADCPVAAWGRNEGSGLRDDMLDGCDEVMGRLVPYDGSGEKAEGTCRLEEGTPASEDDC